MLFSRPDGHGACLARQTQQFPVRRSWRFTGFGNGEILFCAPVCAPGPSDFIMLLTFALGGLSPMSHRRSSPCLGLLVVLAGCALFTACVGASRLPARSRGPAGAQIGKSELDMSFLETAPVTRDDVTSKLASIDTGYHDPHLFWGRWVDSKWGYWWVIVAAGPGSPAAGTGDAKRIWHVKNLLITFDDNG